MDLFEAIKCRRSIRKYTDQPVSDEVLTQLLDAAQWAPSASNQQPRAGSSPDLSHRRGGDHGPRKPKVRAARLAGPVAPGPLLAVP